MALVASGFATWYTALREGSRTLFANETARNAQFQMAKREVFASLLSVSQAYSDDPRSDARQDDFRREFARGLMYARPDVVEVIENELGSAFPSCEPDWDRLTTALRDDIH